ncbi:MAG: hypothetical protein KC502_16550 [Myxococcales bacterium]|nr:hypothetical protein [Myxococcales bacterium]
MRQTFLLLSALALGMLACGGEPESSTRPSDQSDSSAVDGSLSDGGAANDASDASDTKLPESTLGKAPAACGAPAYAWLPHAATLTAPGHLLWHKEIKDFDFSAKNLSTLLKAVGADLPLDYRYDARVFQIRYSTQDRGKPAQATGFVALPTPTSGQDKLEVDLMVYLHGTAGFSDSCAPSDKLLDPVAGASLANVGHVVVAPDYLGMNGNGAPSSQLHPYVIAEPTAIASLDAARATRELLAKGHVAGLSARPGIFVLGGSQGGHAAIAMGAYGAHYAPDEPIVAIATSVPLIDLVGETVLATTEMMLSTENLAAIMAACTQWYGFELSDVIRPAFVKQVSEHVETECTLGGIIKGAKTPEDVFTKAFMDAAANEFKGLAPFSCALRHNSLVHDIIAPLVPVPTLIALAEKDELLNAKIQHAAYDKMCNAGQPVRFIECAGLGHTAGALASIPEQLEFLHARRAGKPLTGTCKRTAPIVCKGKVKLP